jgi:hypothetical protein
MVPHATFSSQNRPHRTWQMFKWFLLGALKHHHSADVCVCVHQTGSTKPPLPQWCVSEHRPSRFYLNPLSFTHPCPPPPTHNTSIDSLGISQCPPHHTRFSALPYTLVTHIQQGKQSLLCVIFLVTGVVKLPVVCPQYDELGPSAPGPLLDVICCERRHPASLSPFRGFLGSRNYRLPHGFWHLHRSGTGFQCLWFTLWPQVCDPRCIQVHALPMVCAGDSLHSHKTQACPHVWVAPCPRSQAITYKTSPTRIKKKKGRATQTPSLSHKHHNMMLLALCPKKQKPGNERPKATAAGAVAKTHHKGAPPERPEASPPLVSQKFSAQKWSLKSHVTWILSSSQDGLASYSREATLVASASGF